ncbi:hypothetical protein D3H35_01275 [Cohnella faecalis]|uniref:Uncharacterized protein n=1 Tax=Cohnella faecalis TaxID=2315694 RepID=A0A398CPI5_9BACL|nr:hypothetical protein D3H35_01275 [Cohnella faecalis]
MEKFRRKLFLDHSATLDAGFGPASVITVKFSRSASDCGFSTGSRITLTGWPFAFIVPIGTEFSIPCSWLAISPAFACDAFTLRV